MKMSIAHVQDRYIFGLFSLHILPVNKPTKTQTHPPRTIQEDQDHIQRKLEASSSDLQGNESS